MAASTPASLDQGKKLLDLVQKCTTEQLQNILTNGDLVKLMFDAPLKDVDRTAFSALLTPPHESIPWRPVYRYAFKIADWNKLRGWGLTTTQITTFARTIVDHLDPLHPTGVSLWLGRDLSYNWEEVMACLKLEVEALGEKFTPFFGAERVSFFPESEQTGGRKLTVALLDLATYWNPTDGVVPNEVRKIEKRLPGLEVAWLLALNPEVYVAIDYETIPGLIAAGLVVGSGEVPIFAHDSDEPFVLDSWAGHMWDGYSVVAFRE
jgi:hypothetical protein